jgi:hypothetical protein
MPASLAIPIVGALRPCEAENGSGDDLSRHGTDPYTSKPPCDEDQDGDASRTNDPRDLRRGHADHAGSPPHDGHGPNIISLYFPKGVVPSAAVRVAGMGFNDARPRDHEVRFACDLAVCKMRPI